MKVDIRATKPFDTLSPEARTAFESSGEPTEMAAGQQLFAFGEAGDAMYLVVEGQLEVLVPDAAGKLVVVGVLGPHTIVGEIQVLTGGARTATVRAAAATRLIRFHRAALERLAATAPEAIAEINTLILGRLRRNQLAMMLSRYFGELSLDQLGEIESLTQWVRLARGETLFRQGDSPDDCYILVSGNLRVLLEDAENGPRSIGRVAPGELVGDMAFFSDAGRSATVQCVREADLVRFPKQAFTSLTNRYPRFALEVARINIARATASRKAPSAQTNATTSVIGLLGAPGAPVTELTRALVDELRPYASVLHLNSTNIEEILRMPGAAQASRGSPIDARVSTWLSAQEGEHQFILLEADAGPTNWTRRCIEQCDETLTVAVAAQSPSLGEVESLLYESDRAGLVRKRLVLIQDGARELPAGTRAWLAPRSVGMHYHVRLRVPEDIARLARHVRGAAICLALGGGGARGYAHLGAYRALQEAGVPIDAVAGTSMGSLIGAEIAMAVTPSRAIEMTREAFRGYGVFSDITLPVLSIQTGRSMSGGLGRVFDDIAIEDLWIPYMNVSSNISHATMAVHHSGLLRQTIRASCSVQGVYPPVVMNGDLHCDGALYSNLPADVMAAACPGIVIAVDVTPVVDLDEQLDYGDTVSGFTLLWRRLVPDESGLRIVDIATVLQRSAEAASMAKQRRVIDESADFYLRMPVDKISMTTFGALDRITKIGYEAAVSKLAEWATEPRWIQSVAPVQRGARPAAQPSRSPSAPASARPSPRTPVDSAQGTDTDTAA